MSIYGGHHDVTDKVIEWLNQIGIDAKEVREVRITFAVNDAVFIDIQKYMTRDELQPFHSLLEELTPEKVLAAERYEILPVPVERADDAP